MISFYCSNYVPDLVTFHNGDSVSNHFFETNFNPLNKHGSRLSYFSPSYYVSKVDYGTQDPFRFYNTITLKSIKDDSAFLTDSQLSFLEKNGYKHFHLFTFFGEPIFETWDYNEANSFIDDYIERFDFVKVDVILVPKSDNGSTLGYDLMYIGEVKKTYLGDSPAYNYEISYYREKPIVIDNFRDIYA